MQKCTKSLQKAGTLKKKLKVGVYVVVQYHWLVVLCHSNIGHMALLNLL